MTDLQKVILNIFKDVSAVCEKYHIKYYAIGGTCLGAIRHKGFIPWDDDLDIAIPVQQFPDFIEAIGSEFPDRYEIVTAANDDQYANTFIKVVDKNTTFIEEKYYNYPDSYTGVWLDVMPLAGIPKGNLKSKIYLSRLRWLHVAEYNMKLNIDQIDELKPLKKIAWYLFYYRKLIRPSGYFIEKQYRLMSRYLLNESTYTGYLWSQRRKEVIFPVSILGNGTKMPFENIEIVCPDNYHLFLTTLFGDYMVIPENHDQDLHHGFIDLKTPYLKYQNRELNGNLQIDQNGD